MCDYVELFVTVRVIDNEKDEIAGKRRKSLFRNEISLTPPPRGDYANGKFELINSLGLRPPHVYREINVGHSK
jgi:hypothetical protein